MNNSAMTHNKNDNITMVDIPGVCAGCELGEGVERGSSMSLLAT